MRRPCARAKPWKEPKWCIDAGVDSTWYIERMRGCGIWRAEVNVRETLAPALGEHGRKGPDGSGERVEFGTVVRTALSWSCSGSVRVAGRLRIHPETVRSDGGRAVTGRGEVRFMCR